MFAARNAYMTPKPAASAGSVSMLLKFDGNFTDSTGNHTITAYGNANPYTGAKFGAYSAGFDGNGDYLIPSAGSDLQFGTGDFCIELWFTLYSYSGKYPFLFDWRPQYTVTAAPALNVNYGPGYGTLNYYAGSGNVINGTTGISTNTWHHAAATRASGVTRLFLNGTQQGSDYADTNDYATNQPTIGALGYLPSLSDYATYGAIDEFRVTKGAARYTSNFTPPTAGFTYP